MWPNTNPVKSFGTALCVRNDDTTGLSIGKRYVILDLDPAALSPTESRFNYLVENESQEYIWVGQDYFAEYVAR